MANESATTQSPCTAEVQNSALVSPFSGGCPWQPAAWETLTEKETATAESRRLGTKAYSRATLATLATAGSDTLAIAARVAIARIKFPKGQKGKPLEVKRGEFDLGTARKAGKAMRNASLQAKARKELSTEDECEVFQAVAMALTARGTLYAERLERDDWKAVFRAARQALDIDRKRSEEITADPHGETFALIESVRTHYDAEQVARARVKLAKRIRYWHACIAKARDVSANRKRRAIHRDNRATLRTVAAGNLTFSGMSQAEMEAASKAKARLFKAIQEGESAFDMEAEQATMEAKQAAIAREALALAGSMLALW